MGNIGYWTISEAGFIEDAKSYAVQSRAEIESVPPRLRLYRFNETILTLTFPPLAQDQTRIHQMKMAEFIAACVPSTGATFIIDSDIEVTNALGEEVTMNAMFLMFASDQGCSAAAYPYSIHPEVEGLIWQDDNSITSSDIISSQPNLVDFAANLFFIPSGIVVWKYYFQYLEANGFKIEWTPPFDINYVSLLTRETL
jgi:hypothetical protein